MSLRTAVLSLCVSISALLVHAAERPNVLFIAVDDLNDFPAYMGRNPDALTPNLDKLAKQGLAFDRAHCQWPTCGPSRNSIMSGLLPTTIGGPEKQKDEVLQQRTRELGTKLLHEYFADHGYKTMAVGKLCHTHVPKGSVDESGGRGSFTAGLGRMGINWSSTKTSTDWAAISEKTDAEFPDHQAADWAIAQLETQHDQPFMLMLGVIRPHVPWYVTKQWFDLYDPAKLTLPPYKPDDLHDVPEASRSVNIANGMPRTRWAIENGQWRNIVHAYLASVSFADHQVGRVLSALEASSYKDNTIIVLWSDHGYHMGEKNTFQKHSLWERATHVPLIFAGPGIEANQRSERVVSLLDVYPTLLDLCELPANPKNEGRSLMPLIEDPQQAWPYPSIIGYQKGSFALQTERYRYIRYQDGSEELYDHEKDLNEWTNLAQNPEFAAVKAKLSAQLTELDLKDTVGWKK